MNRKAFRCGVLALLLTAAFALPAMSSISPLRAKRASRSLRPAVERGILERAWGIVSGLLGGTGRLHALSGANRGGIDPNGAPAADPQANPLCTTPTDPGDNRGGIDPNG
jgi:hypothetical protein